MSEQFTNLTSIFVNQRIEAILKQEFDPMALCLDELRQSISSYVLSQVLNIYNITEAQRTNPIDVEFLYHLLGQDQTIESRIYEGIELFLNEENINHFLEIAA